MYQPSNETGVIEKHDLEVEKHCLNITEDPALESVLTNRQEDVNIETSSKTNKNTKWWPWSKQKQSGKSSDDDCLVISMLEVIERKIEIFEP